MSIKRQSYVQLANKRVIPGFGATAILQGFSFVWYHVIMI